MLLEHLHGEAKKNRHCPNPSAPKLLGVNHDKKLALYIKASCKQWSCPVCGEKNAERWVARVVNGINQYIKLGHWDWYLMTITSHKKMRTTEGSLKNLREGWRKLSNRLWRRWGKGHYVKVYEHHKDGAFHMHVITDISIPYSVKIVWNEKRRMLEPVFSCKWLKDNAAQCGMGYIDDYRPIASPGISAYYVAKYLSKSVGDNGKCWPKNMRRIQCSHNWPKLPDVADVSEYNWQFIANRYELMLRAQNLFRFEDILVTDAQTGKDFTLDDFGFWDTIPLTSVSEM